MAQPAVSSDRFEVIEREIEDLKSVFASVRSKDRIEARVRTPGTIVSLNVDEGASVTAGQVLASVADPKIALRIKALDAQVVGLQSRLDAATGDYERALELRQRGVTPQSRVDQLKAAYDIATNDLKAARAERQVAGEQVTEGDVLAPGDGRVLSVPVTEGSVVMTGESVATIAANAYLLRLELPERHARFMSVGDGVRLGARGAGQDGATLREGKITQVYPELSGGRVVADAEVADLGDYFVGERTLVWISAGTRRAIVVPEEFIFKRFGQDFARVVVGEGRAIDVVVQIGAKQAFDGGEEGLDVLAGLRSGDVLVKPVRPQ